LQEKQEHARMEKQEQARMAAQVHQEAAVNREL